MENQIRIHAKEAPPTATSFSKAFSFAMLIFFSVAQNSDWATNRLLWWGSLGLFLLAFFANQRGKFVFEKNYSIWLLSFVGFCALSCFWAVQPSLVTGALKNMAVHTLVLFAIRSAIKKRDDVVWTLTLFLLSIVINIVWLLITQGSMLSESLEADRLGTGSLWNANTIGIMASLAMLLAFYVQKNAKRVLIKLLCIATMALMILTALLSGSRKALLMVVLGFCGFLLTTSKKNKLKILLVLICSVVGLFFVIMYVPFFYNIIGQRIEGLLAALTGQGIVDSSTQLRNDYFAEAIRIWGTRPLLGTGLDCFRALNTIREGMYAHNNYAELLADVGIVGTAIYYGAFVYCFIGLLRFRQKDNLIWLFLVVWTIFIIMDIGHVSYSTFLYELMLLLMFTIISFREKEAGL